MAKSKLTLLVDGNWLLMSRMSVLRNKYVDDAQLCKDLKLMLIKSINIVLKQFPRIDNIIFVADGGSWRNTLEIPKFLEAENIEYKGNRELDPDFNWDLLWASYEDFISKLKASGITVTKEPGVEGDDWAWYWSTKLNKENTNVIIWTRDKDLTQLVRTDSNGCFTVVWEKDSGVVTEDKPEDEIDFLFNSAFNDNDEIYRTVIDKSKEVKKIRPYDVVIDKIIRGDLGDNVIPILYRDSKTSDKKFRVAAKDLDLTLDIHNDVDVRQYINELLTSKTYVGKVHKPIHDIIEHFQYNKRLVTLERDSYPAEILDVMESKYPDYTCCKNTNEAEYQLTAEANSINSLLDII